MRQKGEWDSLAKHMIKALTPWIVLFLAPVFAPQAGSEVRSYQKIDGEWIRGRVESVEGDRVKMRIEIGNGGSMSRTYPLSQFTPPSHYAARAAVVPADDAAANLELARYAVSTNQSAAARRSLAAARRISGS